MPFKSYPILVGSKRIRRPETTPPTNGSFQRSLWTHITMTEMEFKDSHFCFIEKTKLTAFCEPSRSQWKIMNRQPKASLGHCSSERNTPGWLTTTSPGPLPGSYAALKIRNGGKKMRFGQVGFPFRKSIWSPGILQQVIMELLLAELKKTKTKPNNFSSLYLCDFYTT